MAFEKLKETLEKNGFTVSVFADGKAAAEYLNREIDGITVGCGGSMTLKDLGLQESLAQHNTLYAHGYTPGTPEEVMAKAATAEVYLLSANAIAEDTGEILNIDGTGNRVSATLFGHEKVYFVIGRNKLAPTYEAAVYRARNVAAPQRARQLGKKTPCAVKVDRCYDCQSPERVCRGLVTLWGPMLGMETEVLLVDEDLGL